MIKVPYIKIKQRGETFFVTKLGADFLKNHINFHFRDPYLKYKDEKEMEKVQGYIGRIRKQGLSLKTSSEGIQRRLQERRIRDINKYIESSSANFFPNSIILSVDVSKDRNFEMQYIKYEEEDIGFMEFPIDMIFTVIDGQHRLAGLFLCEDEVVNEFEMVAILLFNTSLSTAAKLFADINGKQKPVNRSLIYDLYDEIETIELEELKKFHIVTQKFYTDNKSPLFRQIKMLGIGKGAVSQAFFIDYVIAAVKKTALNDKPIQDIYNQLFYYFRSFQKTFPLDWPVPIQFDTYEELDRYANNVLKIRKSQLAKTNGFGAIMRLFPEVYNRSEKNQASYSSIISKLNREMSWTDDPAFSAGTGKKIQDYLEKKMQEILFETKF